MAKSSFSIAAMDFMDLELKKQLDAGSREILEDQKRHADMALKALSEEEGKTEKNPTEIIRLENRFNILAEAFVKFLKQAKSELKKTKGEGEEEEVDAMN